MDVLLAGTGSADGWPNPFCACASCTTERAIGQGRGQTSVLVDDTLLLDCGPETVRAVERAGADLTRLRHVLITHQHPDHCAPAFLLFRSWVSALPLDVVGPPEVIAQCRIWVAPDSTVNFVTVHAGDRLQLGDYDVRVLAANHGAASSTVLFDVSSPTARLLYATDTGSLPDDTLEAVRDAAFDLVLLEETFGDLIAHGSDHLDLSTFPEQVRRLRTVRALTEGSDVIAVHLSHHNPPAAELSRRLAAWGARAVDDGTLLHVGGKRTRRAAPSVIRTLVVGGARSGKSREAERLLAAEPEVTYVATSYPVDADPAKAHLAKAHLAKADPDWADPDWPDPDWADPDWAARVRRHQMQRPAHWRTLETTDLVGVLSTQGEPVLIDCLTLWLTRVMDAHDAWDDTVWSATGEQAVEAEVVALLAAWRAGFRRVVAVTNEVGQGVVPGTAAGRRFRDVMGRLNSRVSAETEDVRWCLAGRVVPL